MRRVRLNHFAWLLFVAGFAVLSLCVQAADWVATGAMPDARYGHTATLLPNGKVLVAGGWDDAIGTIASAALYDPAVGTWTATSPMSEVRVFHTATLLPNGKVLVAGGGAAGGEAGASAELYDPATETWSPTGQMTSARDAHTATLLPSGKVLIVGGEYRGYAQAAELYTPETGTWAPTDSMPTPRWYHTATLLPNGKVLVAGGHCNCGGGGGDFLATALLYDPETGTWSDAGLIPGAGGDWPAATLLDNGKVLLAGGFNYYDPAGTFAGAALYDPSTGTWAATGSMPASRSGHTATLLPDGKVIVAGGGLDLIGDVLRDTALYDSSTGTWAATRSMSQGRYFATATLLPNGSVLVAGGEGGHWDGGRISLATAEIYTPDAGGNVITATTLSTSTDSPRFGERVDLTATVSPTSGGPLPTGTVTFKDGTENLGAGTLENGTATFATSSLAAGTSTLTAAYGGDAIYAASVSPELTITVGKADQAIAFGAPPTILVGGNGTVSATGGGSGNPVIFSSQTAGICSSSGTNGSTITGVAAGTCIVAANQAGNANYNPAPEVTQSFSIASSEQPDWCGESVAAYPFDGNANDVSGNGRHGTVLGATLTTDRFGQANRAYRFDGDDYIKASGDGLPTAERTVALWFNADTVSTMPTLVGYGGGDCGTSWLQGLDGGGYPAYWMSGHCGVNGILYEWSQAPENVWTHFAVTTNAQGTKIYVDGVERAANDIFVQNTQVANTDFALGVAVSPGGGAPYTDGNIGYFLGSMDDVMIFDRALTASEIGQLRNNQCRADCQAGPLTLDGTTFAAGTHTRASQISIATQGAVTVQTGANVTFRAPLHRYGPGLRIASGAVFRAQAGAVTCNAAVATPATAARPSAPAAVTPVTTAPAAAPLTFTGMDALPAWVQDRLATRGIDRQAMALALLDPHEQWLLFETPQGLAPGDRNATSDIYRLDLLNGNLTLLSRTPQGTAGNGPSRYPAADALGDWVAFQSEANDLATDDDNEVGDIFLHEVALGQTRRITATAAQASAHPALDATGQDLLYDQQDGDGRRQVLADTLWGGTAAAPLGLGQDGTGAPLDRHHPAISADGRFVAYLTGESGNAGTGACQVHLYDRDSGRSGDLPCPAELAAASDSARPRFSADGTELEWYLPGEGSPVRVYNPLPTVPTATTH